MSTLFKQLEEERRKSESDVLLPTELTTRPKLTGIKIAIVLSFILALTAVAAAGYLYQNFNGELRERRALEVSQTQMENNANALRTQIGQYRVVMEQMRDQLQESVEERKSFKKEFERSQVEISNLQKKIRIIEDRNRAMEEQMAAISRGIREAPAAVVATAGETAAVMPPSPPAPEVLTVNRKFNFVVVNIGLKDNVKLGDEIDVLRNGQIIGTVQVEKLYDNFAAATIVSESGSQTIAEGDSIERAQ